MTHRPLAGLRVLELAREGLDLEPKWARQAMDSGDADLDHGARAELLHRAQPAVLDEAPQFADALERQIG